MVKGNLTGCGYIGTVLFPFFFKTHVSVHPILDAVMHILDEGRDVVVSK